MSNDTPDNPFTPKNVATPDDNLIVKTAGVVSSSLANTVLGSLLTPIAASINPVLGAIVASNSASSIASAISTAAGINADSIGLNRVPNEITSILSPNLGHVQPVTASVGTADNSLTTNTSGTSSKVLNNFLPNVLDDLDNPTYNFKLYLAPEGQLLDSTQTPKGPLYIIAESGVTGNFYVKDVDIESIVGPNSRTRNIRSTIIRMTIVEPQGISLIDKLIVAAADLNIKNINVCPMMIELSFKGYAKSGKNQSLNALTKSFRVNLIEVNTQLVDGGTEYTMSFMVLEDYAFNRFSAASVIQQQLQFPITTVEKFFEDLGYYLTLQSATTVLHSQQGQITRNEYKFNVNPIMAKWKIGENKRNSPSMFREENGQTSIVLNTDMTIDRIVDVVLATTEEGNKMVNPSSSIDKMDKQPKAPNISKIASINGRIEFLSFNPRANDYNRRYVYYINPYESLRTIINRPDDVDQNSRSQFLLQSTLRKKYEYIFTGENTEVLSLDLNLNNLWRAANIYYANALQRKNNPNAKFMDPQNKTSKVLSPDDLRTQAKSSSYAFTHVPGSLDEFISFAKDPSSFLVQNSQVPTTQTDPNTLTLAALDQLTSSGQIDPTKLKTLTQTIDQQITNSVPIQAASANAPKGVPVLSGTQTRLNPKSSAGTNNTLNTTLLETLNTDLTTAKQNPILSMFVKQIDPELDTLRVNNNIEQTTNVGRSIYGIVVNQLYQTQYQDLLKIEMEIRGDPYWLGESDVEIYNRLTNFDITSESNKINPSANFIRGENCLFLTFNTPKNYDKSTGFANVAKADLFIGVYAINKIHHQFSEGKFTQRLECIRDIQTDPKVLAQYVNIKGPTNGLANSPGLNSITSAISKLFN